MPLTRLQTLGSGTKDPALNRGCVEVGCAARGFPKQSSVGARVSGGTAGSAVSLPQQGSQWAFEIIGQFAGSLSASLNITLRQIFLNLDYSLCQDPLAVCQGP